MDSVLDGVAVAHVEHVNGVALLADTLDAALALFEAGRVPREVEGDERAEALEIEALTGGVGANEDLDFPFTDEPLEVFTLGGLAVTGAVLGGTSAAGIESYQFVRQCLLAELGCQPLGGIVVL